MLKVMSVKYQEILTSLFPLFLLLVDEAKLSLKFRYQVSNISGTFI